MMMLSLMSQESDLSYWHKHEKLENITLLQSKIQSETGLNLVVLSGKEETTNSPRFVH